MTARKDDIKLERTPEFVSRETGSAELEISPDTWDRWVRDKKLPPAETHFPAGTARWHWPKVRAWLLGDDNALSTGGAAPDSDIDRAKEGARNLRDGSPTPRQIRAA
jgi:hypothetical protein